jgi:hypothetical protein
MDKISGLDFNISISLPYLVEELLMAKVKWLGSKMIVEKTQIAKGLPW